MSNFIRSALASTILLSATYTYAAQSYFTPAASLTSSQSNTASTASVGPVTPVSPVVPVAPVTPLNGAGNAAGMPANGLGPGATLKPQTLGPGSTTPTVASDFASLIQGLEVVSTQIGNLDNDVKSNDALNNTSWNNYVTMQANNLNPQGTDNYLENGSAFQSISTLASMSFQSNLTTSNINFIASLQNCNAQAIGPGQINSGQCSPNSLQNYAASTLIDTTQYNNVNPSGYINAVFASSELNNPNPQENAANSAVLSAAYSALQSIVNTRSTMMPPAVPPSGSIAAGAGTSANGTNINVSAANLGVSQMAMMQNVVNTTMQQSWLNQIATATSPQLLRSIAILLAYNNYIEYQRYQQEQNTQILLAAQVVQLTKIANLLAVQNKQQ